MNLRKLRNYTNDKIKSVENNVVATDDEKVVFELTMRGKSVQEIADRICCSERTVSRIKRKLNLKIEQMYDL